MEKEFVKKRRRAYFINKKFQGRFIIKFCLLVVIGAFLSGIIVYALSTNTVTTTFENGRLRIKNTADFILPALLLSGAIVSMVVGFATIIIALLTSHKIVGPIYRMGKDINEITSGNLKVRFRLRRNDELKTLAEYLDTMSNALKVRIDAIKKAALELESALKMREKEIPKDVRDKLDKLKAALSEFNT